MNLKEYIDILQDLRGSYGDDIRVVEINPYAALNAVRDAHKPIVETLQIKTKRESYEKIYRSSSYGVIKEDSGIKVIVL